MSARFGCMEPVCTCHDDTAWTDPAAYPDGCSACGCRRGFNLGRTVSTPGALALGADLLPLLARHVAGDWGDVPPEDWTANDDALLHGARVLSSYKTPAGQVWIITEADRSATTFLLPEEY